MKKLLKLSALFLSLLTVVAIQSCKDDPAPAAPTLTGPTTVASVQIGAKTDATFTFTAAAGYSASAVTAVGGTATVKTPPAAGADTGSVVTEFTAGTTAGAGSVTLTLTDNKGKTVTQTAVLNITISAPPTVTLSAATGSAAAGGTVTVAATITAANGAKNISYTTTGGLTGAPASPVAIPGSPTTATAAPVITFTIPATAVVGGTLTAVISGTDNQNLNSSPVTFTVTVSDVANVLTGALTADKTLTAGTPWTIKNQFIVNSGVTLTVSPGAIIKGDKATKGVIVIRPGGKLNAVGTAALPIVFTSSQPIGERDRGDWGGIVWLGNAFVNQASQPTVEGITPAIGYGTNSTSDANAGTNTEDNGKLKYARIEYAGIELTPNNETNGLTMGGVGSGTEIDYVQVSYGGDDSFEWFGGTVNAKHLIAFAGWDDDFDTDFGWRGRVQFGVGIRAPFIADQSGSTAFESDSQANANPIGTICTDTDRTGCTQGVFSNMTIYGPRDYNRAISGSYTRAIHIRRRTAVSIFNSVVTGFLSGVQLDDVGTPGNYLTTYDGTNTTQGKLANNELYVSLLPNVPTTIGSTTTAVTSITLATGNIMFNSGSGLSGTAPTAAQLTYRATGAGNNDYQPTFISTWVSSGTPAVATGQGLRNSWNSSASSLTDLADPADQTNGSIAFAQSADGILVNGVAGATWANGTAVAIVNPYIGSGLRTGPFYGTSTVSSYPADPDFTLNTSDATVAGKRLDNTALFTDAKLPSSFFTPTQYRGAFDGTTDWTNGWSNFVPINAQY